MFDIANASASTWLLMLLTAWMVFLISGVSGNWVSPVKRHPVVIWLLMASSATLVLASWIWYLVARATPTVALFALLLALGMTLGFLGDLLLADALPLKQGFLAGMAAFALGHIAYIVAILALTPHIQWTVEGAALLVALAGWYLVVFRGTEATTLRWAALPYALLVATTAGVAAGLAIQAPTFVPLAIGATLFFVSDLLVAGERFGSLRFPHLRDAVWLTYGPAQMLIVYAVNSALVVAGTR